MTTTLDPTATRLAAIGALIRGARQSRGLTQAQLAERLSTSQSAIARIEQGQQNLSVDMLARINEALEADLLPIAGPAGRSPAPPTCGSAAAVSCPARSR